MKVLVVGMLDSVHVARWLNQIQIEGELELRLFATSPHRRIHPLIATLLARWKADKRISMSAALKWLSLPIWLLDRNFLFGDRLRALFLRHEIRRFGPDFVHILETQNGGYPFEVATRSARKHGKIMPFKVMLTLFGSDLFWFSQYPDHKAKITKLMPLISILSTECERDIHLAKSLGFAGMALPPMPVSGGLPDEHIKAPDLQCQFESRKSIAIKGYGGKWGLGHKAIKALGSLPDIASGYRIEIFSAEREARKAAKSFLAPAGISYVIHRKFALTHSEMLKLYGRSRIYIGLSRSDGLPASMLEAMSQGSFPIQTSTACTSGWIRDGVNGFVLEEPNEAALRTALTRALSDDDLVLASQVSNLQLIREKYSTSAVLSGQQADYSFLNGL